MFSLLEVVAPLACRHLCTLQNPSLRGGFAVVTNSPAVDQTALVCCHVPVLVLYCVVHSCSSRRLP